MNTKIFISLFAFALVFLQHHSIAASHQKHLMTFGNNANSRIPVNNKQDKDIPLDWTFNWQAAYHQIHQQDHDDQTHKFHYEKFSKHRSRILVIIMIKLLLLVTHVSTFLCTSLHLLH